MIILSLDLELGARYSSLDVKLKGVLSFSLIFSSFSILASSVIKKQYVVKYT